LDPNLWSKLREPDAGPDCLHFFYGKNNVEVKQNEKLSMKLMAEKAQLEEKLAEK
jgi:hypothetical protein